MLPGWKPGHHHARRPALRESQGGIMLTDPAGKSRVLAPPDEPNGDGSVDLAWFGLDWWAEARPSGVFAGQIGGALRGVSLLRKCDPGSPKGPPGNALDAVSGEHLYAALPAACSSDRRAPLGAVLDIDVRSRHWHGLSPASRELPMQSQHLEGSRSGLLAPSAAINPISPVHALHEPTAVFRVLNAATGGRWSTRSRRPR